MGKNRRTLITSLIFLVLSSWQIGMIILENRNNYFTQFNPQIYKQKYENSQWASPYAVVPIKNLDRWAISKGYQGWTNYVDEEKYTTNIEEKKAEILKQYFITPISDEELYTYAGYEYVKGRNPILINPETPPLPKYLIGLSLQIFKNQNYFNLLSALLSLMLIYYLCYSLTSSTLISSLAVFLTSIHTSFQDQLIHTPQLDIYQSLFLLSFIIFLLQYLKTNNFFHLIFSGIFLGLFISIKFFLLYFIVLNCVLILFYFLNRWPIKKVIKDLIVINTIGLTIYTLTYLQYFILGGDLRSFLGVQKWIFLFYSQSKIEVSKLFGNYLSLIFLNKWRFWDEGYKLYPYQHWNPLWPIIFLLGIFSLFKIFIGTKENKMKLFIKFVFSLLLVYNLFLFFTPIYPRYLLLLYIPLNLVTGLYLGQLLHTKFNS